MSVLPLLAEAMACRWGLQLAERMSFRRLIIQSDCLLLISQLRRRCLGSTYVDLIIGDMLALSNCCDVVSFSFVRQSGNKVAHYSARLPE